MTDDKMDTADIAMPPLPRPAILLTVDLPMVSGAKVKKQPFYTEDQMREHATAAVLAEREACAKLCEDLDAFCEDDPGSSAAAAIRARATD